MIYLDNAATSHFKPKAVLKTVLAELKNSSNSGRSGHTLAISNALKNEICRKFLLDKLGASDGYQLIFTKNCTEALNLAIFGSLEKGDHVIATTNDHNSILRPLFSLKKSGVIKLSIALPKLNTAVRWQDITPLLEPTTKLITLNLVSNVTGAVCDVEEISKQLVFHFPNPSKRPILLVDGAQGVPIIPIDMKKMKLDMLAVPAHKGLHGIQGVGFLIYKNSIPLKPLVCGGTGTASESVYQPNEPPEAYESGTLFSAGIHGLYEGAKWSFENVERYSKSIKELSTDLISKLNNIGVKVYTSDARCGVITFNIEGFDSSVVSDLLSRDHNIASRSGLHCAPLVHKQLGTIMAGAVRCSLGADSTKKDTKALIVAIKKIKAKNDTALHLK
ncbi:MAG: aminotransferase class V-fold PLP-dependent enzyme [Clostridia bacterium]|nr:aminotransferase class V-fold PLP-dependent enzyme [Clostridia bacterium]